MPIAARGRAYTGAMASRLISWMSSRCRAMGHSVGDSGVSPPPAGAPLSSSSEQEEDKARER